MSDDLDQALDVVLPPTVADPSKLPDTFKGNVLNPVTGEVLDLDRPTFDLAQALLEIREWKKEWLANVERALSAELHNRMDFDGTYTVHLGDLDVTGQGRGKVDYDGDRLHAVLQRFVEQGVISQVAADKACKTETVYRPMKRGIETLLKRGDEVSEAVRACGAEVSPDKRYVRVVRAER